MYKTITSLLLIFILCTSCELAEIGDPVIDPNVDDEFLINLKETLSPDRKQLTLDISTIKKESCLNSSISYSVAPSNGGFEVLLNDIMIPEDCVPGESPAQADIVLDPLLNGTYSFEINLRDRVANMGVLRIDSDRYRLDMNSTNGFSVVNTTLNKIPFNLIWGYIAYQDTSAESTATNFITELADISEEADLLTGSYGYFRVLSENNIVINEQPENKSVRAFAYLFTGTEDALQAIVDDFRTTATGNLEIKMFDHTGWSY